MRSTTTATAGSPYGSTHPTASNMSVSRWTKKSYFVPPYLGPRGWLGVNLDKNLSWDEIQYQVAEAYLHTSRSSAPIEDVIPDVPPPDAQIDPIEFDPFNDPVCHRQLEQVRSFCFALPEVTEIPQFGTPSFKAGKKNVRNRVRRRRCAVCGDLGRQGATIRPFIRQPLQYSSVYRPQRLDSAKARRNGLHRYF